MLTPDQEKYVFRHLSLIDMERTWKSLEKMEDVNDDHIKDALFRDAIVSYVKPFSDNRGQNQRNGLRVSQKGIPSELKDTHKEIVGIRNRLFAHNDLEYQDPEFGPGTSFSVKGYEKVFLGHLVEPLIMLSKIIHGKLMNEMDLIEKNGP